jgi:hypothetical protein
MNDEEFVYETLGDIFKVASLDALLATVEAVAAQAGVSEIKGLSVRDFFEETKTQRAEELVADFADTNHTLASQMKSAWDKLERAQESPEKE